ncbi:MAG TPA: hypothetical protein VIK54_02915 [Acidimicrobiia bacterium]
MTDLHEVAAEYAAVAIVAATPARVIVARGRRLRARRRRRRVIGTVVLIAAVPTVALATIRAHRESSVKVIAPPPMAVLPLPSRSPTTANQGHVDPAVWFIRPGHDVMSTSKSFTAYVTRLACNDGVTGAVLAPTIKASDTRVVVTFTVEAGQPGMHTCIGNRPVPVVVNLGEVVGQRQLVDGACRSGGEAAKTSFCVDGSVRWDPRGA